MLSRYKDRKKIKSALSKLFLLFLSILLFFVITELVLHLPLFNDYFDRVSHNMYYIKNNNTIFFTNQTMVDFDNITYIYLIGIPNSVLFSCGNTNYKTCNMKICETPKIKEDNSNFRIVFIGDSVTHAIYAGEVNNPKKIFTNLLSKKLKNKSTRNINFEIFNFALAGLDFDEIAHTYNYAIKCNPDLVIYGYFQNDDLLPNSIRLLPYLKFRYSNKFYHRSRLSLVIKENFFNSIGLFLSRCQYSYPKVCPFNNFNHKKGDNILDNMINRNNNTKFYIINFPFIKEGYPSDNFVNTYCKKKGLLCLDIRIRFLERGLDPINLRASPEDTDHYGYYGQEVIADIIYEDLISKNLIRLNLT